MANQVSPVNQKQYLDPYSGRLFDFDTTDSRVYLSSAINTLFNAVGSNCILQGIDAASVDYNAGNDVITVVMNGGKAIIDNTLIDFPDQTTLDLDVSGLDDTGKLVVAIGFSYVPTIYANKATMKLVHVSSDGSQILPDSWFVRYDRIVAEQIVFNKTGKTAVAQTWDVVTEKRTMTIQGVEYEIKPIDHLSARVRHLLAP